MEHEERLEQTEQEVSQKVENLEEQGDQMEERTDQLQKKVDEVHEDFEQKKASASVPGAQPGGDPMIEGREESDQLPEEGPDSQVVEDDGDGEAREAAEENPGQGDSDEGQATGNPPADDSAD